LIRRRPHFSLLEKSRGVSLSDLVNTTLDIELVTTNSAIVSMSYVADIGGLR